MIYFYEITMRYFNKMALTYKFNPRISRKLNGLLGLDNYHSVIALLQDWGIIILAGIVANHYFYLYPFCLFIIGSRQRALGTLFHDAAHGVAAKNRKLNFLVGSIFSGYWIFLSLPQYKLTHVKNHHAYLGDENIDPDFKYYIDLGLYDPSLTGSNFLLRHVVAVLFLLKVPNYLYYLIKNRASSIASYPLDFTLMLLQWSIVISITVYYQVFHLIILYWLIPLVTAYAVIGYFIEIAEHYPLMGKSNEVIHLSRNRFSHWIEDLFFSIHNENYHLTHHLRPGIPFWNMKKSHEIMMEDGNYRKVNEEFGGIFISKNSILSLLFQLSTRQ